MDNKFKKNKKRRRAVYSRVTLVILLLLLIVVVRATWGVYQKEKNTQKALSEVSTRYQELALRHAFLKDEINALGTPEGVESEIRGRFGLAQEGEGVVILVDPESDNGALDTGNISIWERIKRFFGND